MNIALCISGQPRYHKEGFRYIEKYINQYNMDVFFHTWWGPESVGKTYGKAVWAGVSDNELVVKDNVVDDLVGMYKPKSYLYDDIKIFDAEREYETGYDYKVAYNNIKSMYYSMKEVVGLKMKYEQDNDIEYDFVIHNRFDNNIQNFPDLYKLDRNFIYFQVSAYKINPKTRPNIYDDTISICGGKLYNIRKQIFDNVDEYYDKMIYMRENNIDDFYINQHGKFMNAEELLSFNMYDNEIVNVKKIDGLRSVVITKK